MFDIGFSELVVIAVVALIVIGPERLPKAARTMGHLFGRLQRYVNDVKADINREIELEELRKMRDSMQKAATDFQSSVQTEINTTEADLNKSVEDLNKSVEVDWREAKPAEASPAEKKPEEEKKPA
jgi:sec-independent protein translocase protein TatB